MFDKLNELIGAETPGEKTQAAEMMYLVVAASAVKFWSTISQEPTLEAMKIRATGMIRNMVTNVGLDEVIEIVRQVDADTGQTTDISFLE